MKRDDKTRNRHYQLLITALLVCWLLPGAANVNTDQHLATLQADTHTLLVSDLDSGVDVDRTKLNKHKSCVAGGPCDRSRPLKKASRSNKRDMLMLALAFGIGAKR